MAKNNHEDRAFWDGIEREKERQHRILEKEERKKCGVETYRKKREVLDGEWGLTYPRWIQRCYIQRMAQILNDPAEFGKIVLEGKKRDHCVQNADLGCEYD